MAARKQERGQIIQRGPGAYMVRLPLGRDGSGKRKFYSKTIRGTRKDAQRHLTEKLREFDTGSFVGTVRRTLLDFGTEWLEQVSAPRVSRKTQEDYEGLFTRHIAPTLGSRQLGALRLAEIQKLYNDLRGKGLSARSVRYVHSVLNNILDHAVRTRLLSQNPAKGASLPRSARKETRVFTKEEVIRFLDAARQDRYAALWEVLVATGVRPGEAEGLRWEDVREDCILIRRSLSMYSDGTWEFKEPKTAKGVRSVPLSQTTRKALDRHRALQNRERLKAGPGWRGDLNLVFANETGGPIDHRVVMRRHFKRILKNAGLPIIRPYALRHTCASLLLQAKVAGKVISERLGHANVAFTMETYAHVMPGMQEEATEVMERILTG